MILTPVKFDRPAEGFQIGGRFMLECVRPNGTVRWREPLIKNQVLNGGLTDLLNTYFNGGTQITNWYMGLIGGTSVSIDEDDTMSSHSGWTEDTNYDQLTRPEWEANNAANQITTNTTSVQFSINASTTIRGIFIVSNNTKGGTSGILWAAAALSTSQTVSGDEILRGIYSVEALDG